jgi:D-lactate dehydrogenase
LERAGRWSFAKILIPEIKIVRLTRMGMKVAVFSTKSYDREFLEEANGTLGRDLVFFEPHLTNETSSLAYGFEAVCVFVNDRLDTDVLKSIVEHGTRLIALRCAGFNNVDLFAAQKLAMTVVRVPSYSPEAVAEHTIALILSLNRKVHRAYARVREGNFSLEGLLGFNLHDKTFGIIGTGKIGLAPSKILKGFGCTVLAYDLYPDPECKAMGAIYTIPSGLFRESDIISLHCQLTP